MRPILFIVLMLFSCASLAQSSQKKGDQSQNMPSSVNPNYAEKHAEQKKARNVAKSPTYGAEEKYYERLALLEKTRRKNEKLMLSPQYSNPSYFGHKRPPRKRKPGKMKYCHECGIRH